MDESNIQRHAFFCWLDGLEKLKILDRLMAWGIAECIYTATYAHKGLEDHSDLFFECPFSSQVWVKVCEALDCPPYHSWRGVTSSLVATASSKSRGSPCLVLLFTVFREQGTVVALG